MRLLRLPALITTTLLLTSAACSSGSSVSDSSLAATLCTFFAHCEAMTFYPLYGNLATCETNAESFLQHFSALDGITQSELASMQQRFATATCAYGYNIGIDVGFNGSLPNGAYCLYDVQCASGRCNSDEEGCGACVGGGQGSTCNADIDCQYGATCYNNICFAGQQGGASCQDWYQCISSNCIHGVCAEEFPSPVAGAGNPCQATTDCQTGLSCDSTHHCVTPTFLAPGSACDPTSSTPLCLGGTCDATSAVCVATLAVGAACTSGSQCLNGCGGSDGGQVCIAAGLGLANCTSSTVTQ